MAQSENFARLWAKQQAEQAFQTDMTQREFRYAQERANIGDQSADLKAGIQVDEGDPYQQAMIRSLTGLAPYALTAGIQRYGKRTPKLKPLAPQGVQFGGYNDFQTT